MIAGIDGGTTNSKVAWEVGEVLKLRTTAEQTWDSIIEEMLDDGVRWVR
jgi:hypothetical protein